ncbi:MAG: pyrroline-5-carboxylate reductase [Cytophagales bacterium]|nr:MAG: pyrroline-5-carboxylate reductase [Cytophagales bacterium]
MKIAILGCGNMGYSYAKAFIRNKIVTKETLFLLEKPEYAHPEMKELGTVIYELNSEISTCEAIIFAVKPQDAHSVYPDLKKFIKPEQLLLTIMAGKTIEVLNENLGHKNIVRAMPNTPAQIGFGISAYTPAPSANKNSIELAEKLLAFTGKTVFLTDESQLDAVTALSGSGPAYFYYIVNAMIEAGKKLGIEEKTSTLLIKETMNGAFHLMENSNKNLLELIAAVKSKGGTTEAALNVFSDKKLDQSIELAIFAAEKRAKELSKI